MKKHFSLASYLSTTLKYLGAACLLTLASCTNVVSKKPVGETAAHLDPKDWNGAWAVSNGQSIHVCVKATDPSVLEVGWVDIKDGALQFQKLDVHVSEAGGWLWASFREKQDQPYTIARISAAGDHFLAWTLLAEPLAQAVKSGALKGEIQTKNEGKDHGPRESKDILLDTLTDKQLMSLKEGKYGEVFDWGKPVMVLTRLKE